MGVSDVVDVVAWVVGVALLVVVRAVVVVRPLVLVEVPGVLVVGAHAWLPTEPATWNGTWATLDATLRPARSAGTVGGAVTRTLSSPHPVPPTELAPHCALKFGPG